MFRFHGDAAISWREGERAREEGREGGGVSARINRCSTGQSTGDVARTSPRVVLEFQSPLSPVSASRRPHSLLLPAPCGCLTGCLLESLLQPLGPQSPLPPRSPPPPLPSTTAVLSLPISLPSLSPPPCHIASPPPVLPSSINPLPTNHQRHPSRDLRDLSDSIYLVMQEIFVAIAGRLLMLTDSRTVITSSVASFRP